MTNGKSVNPLEPDTEAKAKELGLSDLEAAARLIAEDKMDGIKSEKEYETTLVYMMKNTAPDDYAPRVVFSRSRSIE